MKIKNDRLLIVVLLILIYFLLEYCYVNTIAQNYGRYRWFFIGEPDQIVLTLTSLVPLFLTILLLIIPSTDLIFCILSLVLILIIFPSSILLRYLNCDYRVFTLNSLYFIFIYATSRFFTLKVKISTIKESQKPWILLGISLLLFAPFVIIFGGSIDFSNLLLENIYDSRTVQKDLSNLFTAYAYSPLSSVLIPLLLIFSILHKQYIIALLAFLMLMFMFLVGGHKSVFLGSVLIVFFYYGSYMTKMKLFYVGVSVVLLGSIILSEVFDNLFLVSHISERVFFMPAIIDVAYFKFFDGTPIYWSDSILRNYIAYPFELTPPYAIGLSVMGNSLLHANTGIISDGFMNFGVIGSICNMLFVGIFFGLLNALNVSHRFFGLIFLLFITFSSAYFLTAMVTHGGLLFLIMAHYFLKDTSNTLQ